jgi:hypothetical protein
MYRTFLAAIQRAGHVRHIEVSRPLFAKLTRPGIVRFAQRRSISSSLVPIQQPNPELGEGVHDGASIPDNSNSEKIKEQANEPELEGLVDVPVKGAQDSVEGESSGTDLIIQADVNDSVNEERYHHYFDTQKIYTSFKYSGFADGQADVLMLTIRDMLSKRLASCRESSYPVWAAENEAYLFEAACSELRNDIQISRQAQAEEYRSNLARLQRDVEISQQELNEMMTTLKNEIEMEVNERKDATKAEESLIDLQIQEVNNRITIEIISDVKSEIEVLRWQTTRRGLVAVLLVATAILLATSATKKEEKAHQTKRDTSTAGGGEEYVVPILAISEDDDYVEDKSVESLPSAKPISKR